MNVVMPTGMITMHQDPELSANSKMTSERGIRVLQSIRDQSLVQENCQAILAVANDDKNTVMDDNPSLSKKIEVRISTLCNGGMLF